MSPVDALKPRSSRQGWHTMPVADVLVGLRSGPRGLSEDEALSRLAEAGANVIGHAAEESLWRILLRQLSDPLIYILVAAAAVTLALRDISDTIVILTAVAINTAVGCVQEVRARRAMRALADMAAPRARVRRNGNEHKLAASDLVPGDIVMLDAGTRVPADSRLIELWRLQIDESMLTGESEPAAKQTDALHDERLLPSDQNNMAFAGTLVTRGSGLACVVRTGASTELGRIAATVIGLGDTATPLQSRMRQFARVTGLAIVALTSLVLLVGLLRAMPPAEIFLTAVALTVSAIPEGLPVVLTVTLAVGAQRMSRQNAIVRVLSAVEALGCTSVIGSDKTGTLTRNELTVRAVHAGGRDFELAGSDGRAGDADAIDGTGGLRAALRAAVLANEVPWPEAAGDPTDVALLAAAAATGVDPARVREECPRVDLVPFQPERRMMYSLHDCGGNLTILVKGAPEVILPLCVQMDPEQLQLAQRFISRCATTGMRVLALASGPSKQRRLGEVEDTAFELLGIAAMHDPLRPEAMEAVRAARDAGIRVLMLTGDHASTALSNAERLGLCGPNGSAVTGEEIDSLADAELDAVLSSASVYARVAPEHKLRIVQRLKAAGETVAVTGDGANDAPALRAAHIGVAMGLRGTDAAREAADIVLADDNFATITAAVREGRIVFANIRKVTFFLLSTAAGELIAILASMLAGWPLPFTAGQILWINLVTDGVEDVALAFEPGESDLLRHRPRPALEGVLTRMHLLRLVAIGALMACGTLAVFWWSLRQSGDLAHARSVAVTQMVVFQIYHVFNCRSLDRSIFRIAPFSNRFLFVSMVAVTLVHLLALYWSPVQRLLRFSPLTQREWTVVLLLGLLVIAGGELDKLWNRWRGTTLG